MNSFNEEQLEFIKSPDVATLIGIPGGGKTRSIIGKINHLLSEGEITKGNQVLIVTFSRMASQDFLLKSQEFLLKSCDFDKKSQVSQTTKNILNSTNVRTIHSVAGSLYKDSKSIKTCILGAHKAMSDAYAADSTFRPDHRCFSKLKYIFVDEAQDISEVQYKFISLLAKINNARLILVGDPNQSIYQFQGGSDKWLMEHPGARVVLRRNYRSTDEIIRFCDALRPWAGETAKSTISGAKPHIFCGTRRKYWKTL